MKRQLIINVIPSIIFAFFGIYGTILGIIYNAAIILIEHWLNK